MLGAVYSCIAESPPPLVIAPHKAAKSLPPPCVGHDILDFLPEDARDTLDANMKELPVIDKRFQTLDQTRGIQAKREMFFDNLSVEYRDGASDLFAGGCLPCVKHGKDCHGAVDPGFPKAALTLYGLGNTCLGYSPLGSRQGDGHSSRAPFIVWAARTRIEQPMIMMQENHSSFPMGLFEWWFGDLYDLHQVLVEPIHIGWPMFRDRAYIWAIRKDLSFSGSAEDFLSWSERIMQMNGDDLIIAPDVEYQEEVTSLARLRFSQPPSSVPNTIASWSKLMSISMSDRMSDHFQEYMARGAAGCYIADVDQNLHCGPASRDEMIPTLVTHGTLMSFSKEVMVAPSNHLVFQGLPIYPALVEAAKYTVPFQELLDTGAISKNQAKRLAGNAMCMPIMGLQLAYVLGHLSPGGEPRDVLVHPRTSASCSKQRPGTSSSSGGNSEHV